MERHSIYHATDVLERQIGTHVDAVLFQLSCGFKSEIQRLKWRAWDGEVSTIITEMMATISSTIYELALNAAKALTEQLTLFAWHLQVIQTDDTLEEVQSSSDTAEDLMEEHAEVQRTLVTQGLSHEMICSVSFFFCTHIHVFITHAAC